MASINLLDRLRLFVPYGKTCQTQRGNKQSNFHMSEKRNKRINREVFKELNVIMVKALTDMHLLVENDTIHSPDYASMASTFILGLLKTAADLGSIAEPVMGAHIYALVEKGAKDGGLNAVRKHQDSLGGRTYAIADLEPDDIEGGMNYLGKELSVALYKHLHDLPTPLGVAKEMPLRAIEVLLANLLSQRFHEMRHEVLDQFCEHVHMALDASTEENEMAV